MSRQSRRFHRLLHLSPEHEVTGTPVQYRSTGICSRADFRTGRRYVASAEPFDLLPSRMQEKIFGSMFRRKLIAAFGYAGQTSSNHLKGILKMENQKKPDLFVMAPEGGCGCSTAGAAVKETAEAQAMKKVLNVDLLVIDLTTCKRCVPTGDQLQEAVRLLAPVAEALGIDLRHREIVVQTPQEAKENALLSSPTIRINGRDIEQDIRESLCESCGDLTGNNTMVDCREWHYRGKVYSAAPLPLLIEAIMAAMLAIDQPPVVPQPLEALPENLERYFANKKLLVNCC